jgi:hypothetical protein
MTHIEQSRADLATIRQKIAHAEHIVGSYEANRAPHLVAASKGNQKAIHALDALRREVLEATESRDDLRAAEKLAAAALGQAERVAHEEERRRKVRELALERLGTICEMKRLRDALQTEFETFKRQGAQLLSLAPPQGIQSVSQTEEIIGVNRCRDMLPPFVYEFLPIEAAAFARPSQFAVPLERSERGLWHEYLNDSNVKAA